MTKIGNTIVGVVGGVEKLLFHRCDYASRKEHPLKKYGQKGSLNCLPSRKADAQNSSEMESAACTCFIH